MVIEPMTSSMEKAKAIREVSPNNIFVKMMERKQQIRESMTAAKFQEVKEKGIKVAH